MPLYTVNLTRPVEESDHLAIEDERSLAEIASDLQQDGYIITTDVTAYSGKSRQAEKMALFVGDVSRIYSDD